MLANQLVDEITDPRLMIGGNRPPLDVQIGEELAPFRLRQVDLLEVARTAVIVDAESAAKVTDLIVQLRTFERDVDAAKDEIKRPFVDACRQIDAAFRTVKLPIEDAHFGEDGRGGLTGMLTAYQKRIEAEHRARVERFNAEQRQRDAEAEAARRAAEPGSAAVADALTEMQEPPIRPSPIRSHLGTAAMKREIAFQITDLRLLLSWMLKGALRPQIEQSARTIMGKYLRALGVATVAKGVVIPGVEAGIEKIATVR